MKPSLSAGRRVQSVAVRLIVDRSGRSLDFDSKSAFRIAAVLTTDQTGSVRPRCPERFATETQGPRLFGACGKAEFTVAAVEESPANGRRRRPSPPAPLQQEASRKLGFGVNRTMRIAEVVRTGHAYMRTDSS